MAVYNTGPAVNLTTITPNSSNTDINNNFRKIQAEVNRMRNQILPLAEKGEEAKDWLDRYVGGLPPLSQKEAEERFQEAAENIENAKDEIERAKQELEDMENYLESVKQQLESLDEDLRQQLIDAEQAIQDTQRSLDEAAAKLNRRIDDAELGVEMSYYPNALPVQFSRASEAYVEF